MPTRNSETQRPRHSSAAQSSKTSMQNAQSARMRNSANVQTSYTSRTNTTRRRQTSATNTPVSRRTNTANNAPKNIRQNKQGSQQLKKKSKNTLLSNKFVRAALAVVILLAVLFLADTVLNWGKAYPGVKIAGIDVGGMNAQQIEEACSSELNSNLYDSSVDVAANEEAYNRILTGSDNVIAVNIDTQSTGANNNAESTNSSSVDSQNSSSGGANDTSETEASGEDASTDTSPLSVEEATNEGLLWSANPQDLNVTLDMQSTIDKAINVGRSNGGFFARIHALFAGESILPVLVYENDELNTFIDSIDSSIGTSRIDASFTITDGVATPTDGQDGYLINRDAFSENFSNAIFSSNSEDAIIVANLEDAPMRISYEQATDVCNAVNNAISDGVVFIYEGSGWQATRIMVGSWITSSVEQTEDTWKLVPKIDSDSAKPAILEAIKQHYNGTQIDVSFEINNNEITVKPKSDGVVPLVDQAINELNASLFGTGGTQANEALENDGEAVQVSIASTQVSSSMSFEEAINSGVVQLIESYTTSYTTSSASTDRNYNIHLAADLINNSICQANGGTWSFNNICGECNSDKGFKSANIIVDGEYVDSVGGGICQIATTVFNSVFEAGYHVNKRYNHSLYSSNYPEGRDAAINWPDLDLEWQNDTNSDVLVTTSYTDSTVTVYLYGVDPEYSVTSELGDRWNLVDYETKYVVDESLGATESYVKTQGDEGFSIACTRNVYDKGGELIDTQIFTSYYDPKSEVVYCGSEYEIPEEDS